MGWLANAIITYAMWQIGNKKRWAFLIAMLGEALWAKVGYDRGEFDLMSVCILFAVIQLISWWKWRK